MSLHVSRALGWPVWLLRRACRTPFPGAGGPALPACCCWALLARCTALWLGYQQGGLHPDAQRDAQTCPITVWCGGNQCDVVCQLQNDPPVPSAWSARSTGHARVLTLQTVETRASPRCLLSLTPTHCSGGGGWAGSYPQTVGADARGGAWIASPCLRDPRGVSRSAFSFSASQSPLETRPVTVGPTVLLPREL